MMTLAFLDYDILLWCKNGRRLSVGQPLVFFLIELRRTSKLSLAHLHWGILTEQVITPLTGPLNEDPLWGKNQSTLQPIFDLHVVKLQMECTFTLRASSNRCSTLAKAPRNPIHWQSCMDYPVCWQVQNQTFERVSKNNLMVWNRVSIKDK